MDTIQIKNVRSLKDTKEVKLSPLTLLVGENSSGKSTFLRLFPLIKQSTSKRTDGPLLWAGDVDDYVDFGSFAETVTNDGSNDMTFCFSFSVSGRIGYYPTWSTESLPELAESMSKNNQVHYAITIAQKNAREYISKVNVQINRTKFGFELQQTPFVGEICVDDSYYCHMDRKRYNEVHGIYYGVGHARSSIFGYALPNISPLIEDILQKFFEIEAEPGYIIEDGEGYIINNRHSYTTGMLRSIGQLLCSDVSWKEIKATVKRLNSSEDMSKYWNTVIDRLSQLGKDELKETFAVFKLIYFYEYFSRIDRYLESYFRQVHYIAPLRATAERYYRLRNLAIDEVDYQGKNLAIFLSGLSKKRLQDFQEWTKTYFGFFVTVPKSFGHLSIKINLNDGGDPVNMSDTGFGYSQILPIITQIWDLSTSQKPRNSPTKQTPLVIAIEQPELHLHPALQAKLAKAFIASIKLAESNGYQLQMLIETHSETIINFFGQAVAAKKLSNKDVSVVLFDRDRETKHTKVRTSGYDSDGYLTNWPVGFFAPKEW